jgi:hypothetical protein
MNDTFTASLAAESVKANTCPDCFPQRRGKAARHLQKLEKNLTDNQKVAMLDLFETSTAAADMFLVVDPDNVSLQWAWILNKLKHMGHPLPPWDVAAELMVL